MTKSITTPGWGGGGSGDQRYYMPTRGGPLGKV